MPQADDLLYIIRSTHHLTDDDGQAIIQERIQRNEGYFLNKDLADQRVEQHNQSSIRLHEADERRREEAHASLVAKAKRTNAEAAAIRAAGMDKGDVPMPRDYEPRSLEAFMATTKHIVYDVAAIPRSNHDIWASPSGENPWWIAVHRQHHQNVAIGPFTDEAGAVEVASDTISLNQIIGTDYGLSSVFQGAPTKGDIVVKP